MVSLSLAVVALGGCRDLISSDLFDVPNINLDALGDIDFDGELPNVDPTTGLGIGEGCDANAFIPQCRYGLRCVDGACKTVGDTPEGQPCILTNECTDTMHCSVTGLCSAAGAGVVGDVCTSGADCEHGLVCAAQGFSGFCQNAGEGDLDAPCTDNLDCLAGLVCGGDGLCSPGSIAFGFKIWPGVTCAPEDDAGAPRVYFEIPGDTAPDEFFRLPFPNDIRTAAGGTVDLSGFPTPGPGLVGFDVVERIVQAAEAIQTGWSTVPSVFFRFSTKFKLGSVWARGVSNPPPGEPTLYFVNIDPDSAGYGGSPAFSYFLTDGGSRYICPRYLQVRPSWSTPLAPGTTYAVILAKGVETTEGAEVGADTDFTTLMAASAPEAPSEKAAWDAYAPLRAYLADDNLESAPDAARVIAATVFTTQETSDVLPKIREAIHAEPVPTPTELTLCGGVAVSPCDDALSGDEHVRGCFGEDPAVHELHFKLAIPKLQEGTRPYLTPDDGGGMVFGASGDVVLQGTEDVCVSLTIPKDATMPAEGWPLAIFGHGTGGTFRSSVNNAGVPLSAVTVGDATVGVAVVGWDGPMHGDRRGQDLDPEGLFYNFANPIAARANAYQGAADVFELIRAIKGVVLTAGASPTGEEIRFDATRIAHIGHSQGATTGPLASPYEPDIDLNVWSGAGAGLIQSLLNKREPVDIPLATAVVLQEFSELGVSEITQGHPVLSLVQGLFDPVDPLNHAHLLFHRVREGITPQHVLHVYGIGDSFTPPPTIETFAKLMRVDHAPPVIDDFGLTETDAPPVTGNLTRNQQPVTGVLVQTQPSGYDGHFVMFQDAATQRQFKQFVATWVTAGVPTLVAR